MCFRSVYDEQDHYLLEIEYLPTTMSYKTSGYGYDGASVLMSRVQELQ